MVITGQAEPAAAPTPPRSAPTPAAVPSTPLAVETHGLRHGARLHALIPHRKTPEDLLLQSVETRDV
jgi:hypothetical protein